MTQRPRMNYHNDTPGRFFGSMSDADELVHPIPDHAGFEWTETNMYGFNIPEHDIDCIVYLWHHPALKVSYGGVTIWQGFKKTHLEAEAHDFRMAMAMPAEPTDATFPTGLTVKMIKPKEEFHITFKHGLGDAELDLHLTAAMPPAVRFNSTHLTQMMKTEGTLKLQGKEYRIDGFHSRDRSWGEHRTETPMDIPPISWMVGTFGEDFAMHACAFESRDRHPEWEGLYPTLQAGNELMWGYIWDQGRLIGVTKTDHFVHRAADGLTPDRIELVIHTEEGTQYRFDGVAKSMIPQPGWPNMTYYMGLIEWTYGDRKGYGDIQNVFYGPATRRFRKDG